jgi:hypothetical protein
MAQDYDHESTCKESTIRQFDSIDASLGVMVDFYFSLVFLRLK